MMDIDKKIAEIEMILNHGQLDFEDWEGIEYTREEAMQWLIDQLKVCRELLVEAHGWLTPLRKVYPGESCYEWSFMRQQERLDEWMRKYYDQS